MRTVRVLGASLTGTEAELVTVEARFERREQGRTEIALTGLPDPVLRESRGRVESALFENGLRLPSGRLFLNLVPAGRRKSGEILDLALAIAAGAATGHLDPRWLVGTLFLGELGIDGALHAVPGGLAAALAARAAGLARVVAAPATAEEAACVSGLCVHRARNLAQVLAHLSGARALDAVQAPADDEAADARADAADVSLDDVRGLASAKHALAVAAAGGHGLLLVGPPGSGKSLLARRLVRLLPPPSLEERLEITRVLSAVGRWPRGLARTRPFRAPHHTTSYAGLVGGGRPPAPGEITLAHRGVLFLDELPEFRREALEALRQPLEAGRVTISRAREQLELPARFQLVCAMNPCPCGWHGHARARCTCPPSVVARYRRRISGPLLDRVELRLEIVPPELDELAPAAAAHERTRARAEAAEPASGALARPAHGAEEAALRERVARAVERAHARQGCAQNAALSADDLDRWAALDAASRTLLRRACAARDLSARAVQALRRVARTLADLDASDAVRAADVARALALRAPLEDG